MLRLLRNLFSQAPSPEVIQTREEIYTRHFGAEPAIYHSTNWRFPHVDVYDFPPSATRPFHVLVTGGMAEYLQPAADSAPPARLELMLNIATVGPTAVHVLKTLAEYPARFDTFFASGHTVPIGEAWSADSQIGGFLLAPPDDATASALAFSLEGDAVQYLVAVPITLAELAYAREVDSRELLGRLREANLLVHVDDRRQSVIEEVPQVDTKPQS